MSSPLEHSTAFSAWRTQRLLGRREPAVFRPRITGMLGSMIRRLRAAMRDMEHFIFPPRSPTLALFHTPCFSRPLKPRRPLLSHRPAPALTLSLYAPSGCIFTRPHLPLQKRKNNHKQHKNPPSRRKRSVPQKNTRLLVEGRAVSGRAPRKEKKKKKKRSKEEW